MTSADLKRKPRIAIIGLKGLPAYGGSARAGENMILHLKATYDFVVYNTASHTERRSGFYDGVEQVVLRRFPIRRLNTIVYYLRAALHCFCARRIDAVHVFHLDAAFVIPFLRLRFAVIAGHRARPQEFSKWGPLARRYFDLMEWIFYRYPADVLTSVTPLIVERFQGRTKRRIFYIPNGVVAEGCGDRPTIPYRDYVLFAAGRIMQTKGAHLLLQALRTLDYRGKLLMLGSLEHDVAYARGLRELASGLDVEFLGLIKDKARLMAFLRHANLIVNPTLHEGMSNMLLESASVGRPLICSDIPENGAVFEPDEAVFFRSGCSSDLAQKIAWVQANADAALETAIRGQRKIRTRHDWAVLAGRYDELYRHLVSDRRPIDFARAL